MSGQCNADREGAAVEALTERLRREFWRPENGGQWERIARAVIAAGWVPQSEVTERERAAAEKALRDLADEIDPNGYGWTGVRDAERFRAKIRDRADRLGGA